MRPSPAGTSITLPPDTGSRKEIEMKTRNRILHAALACALLSFAAAAAAQEEPARQPAPQASATPDAEQQARSEEHTSELQSLMRISYAVFCLKKKTKPHTHTDI